MLLGGEQDTQAVTSVHVKMLAENCAIMSNGTPHTSPLFHNTATTSNGKELDFFLLNFVVDLL